MKFYLKRIRLSLIKSKLWLVKLMRTIVCRTCLFIYQEIEYCSMKLKKNKRFKSSINDYLLILRI